MTEHAQREVIILRKEDRGARALSDLMHLFIVFKTKKAENNLNGLLIKEFRNTV